MADVGLVRVQWEGGGKRRAFGAADRLWMKGLQVWRKEEQVWLPGSCQE